MKIRFLLPNLLLCVFVVFAAGVAAHAQSSYFDQQYRNTLARITQRFLRMEARRISPIKKINRSYENTQKALNALSLRDYPRAETLLTHAYSQYKDNILATVILGTHIADTGTLADGAPYFQLFIQHSFTVSKIENSIITPEERGYLRSYIITLLQEHGFDTESAKKPLSATFRIGLERLNAFPEESRIGVILFTITIVGAMVLAVTFRLTRRTNTEFPPSLALPIRLYSICVIAYVLWLIHVYFALPPFIGNSLTQEIMVIIGASICTMVGLWIWEWRKERKAIEDDPDTIICPSCKKPILKVLTQCPHCKHTIEH